MTRIMRPTPEMDLAELKILAAKQSAAMLTAYQRGRADKAATFAQGLKRTNDQIAYLERMLD